jgi:hypothetical protein
LLSGNIKEGFRVVKKPNLITPAPHYIVKRGVKLLDEQSNPYEI